MKNFGLYLMILLLFIEVYFSKKETKQMGSLGCLNGTLSACAIKGGCNTELVNELTKDCRRILFGNSQNQKDEG